MKHSITCAVFQQLWLVLKYKVYHILDANSLVSTPAWGDPEDKCSFPEWFIMLRLHYLAFGGWQNKKPLFNSSVNFESVALKYFNTDKSIKSFLFFTLYIIMLYKVFYTNLLYFTDNLSIYHYNVFVVFPWRSWCLWTTVEGATGSFSMHRGMVK